MKKLLITILAIAITLFGNSCGKEVVATSLESTNAESVLNAEYDVVAMVATNAENAPISDFSETKNAIENVCYKRGRVIICEAGGNPYIAYDELLPAKKTGVSKTTQERNSQAFADELITYAMRLTPTAPENDVLQSLSLAIRKMSTYSGKKLLILDGPGIFTTGVVSMSHIMSNDTKTVIDQLIDANSIPKSDGNISVVCTGLGEPCGNQPRPSSNDYIKLENFYRAYFEAAGVVNTAFIPNGKVSEAEKQDYPSVSVYEFPNTSILTESEVNFIKNSAEFVKPEQAKTIIENVACNYSSGDKVLVAGFCSSEGDREQNNKLALERADTVGRILEDKGLKVISIGCGYDLDYCISDTTIDGKIDQELASKNRKVIIMKSSSAEAQKILKTKSML